MTTRITAFALGITATAACTGADEFATGPTISATLTNNFGTASSLETNPALRLAAGASAYTVRLAVMAEKGQEGKDEPGTVPAHHAVTVLDGALAVGGLKFPVGPHDTEDDTLFSAVLTVREPFVIPASQRGSVLAVELRAEGEDGLSSNLLAFDVRLD